MKEYEAFDDRRIIPIRKEIDLRPRSVYQEIQLCKRALKSLEKRVTENQLILTLDEIEEIQQLTRITWMIHIEAEYGQ